MDNILINKFISYISENNLTYEKEIDEYLKNNDIYDLKPYLKDWFYNDNGYQETDDIKLIKKEDVIACYYASPGSMGDWGTFKFITNKGEGFEYNYYTTKHSFDEIADLCGGFDENSKWRWIGVSAGHSFCILPEYAEELNDIIDKLMELFPTYIWRGLDILNYIIKQRRKK